ncbi:tyrosine-type recombinase/integrase [Fictibacillus phosphorivorans]|uniref:tyrosine-type recombinase/integrase n=1 Tax=Fictibacillus phosphorivorans TaxID=1221500 RepID=UPI003CF26279
MGRRSNELNMQELKVVQADTKATDLTVKEAIELFTEDCIVRNLREHTVKYYNNELGAFIRLLQGQGVELTLQGMNETIIKENVIKAMQGQGIKPVSINTRLTALRAFFNWLHKQRYIKRNPMAEVSMLNHRKEIIETLTVEQLNQLLNACDLRTFTGVRDYTILLLFIETGVRVNELAGIEVGDINFAGGNIHIRNAKSYTERVVPIQTRMKEQLRKWLAVRGDLATEALFVTVDNTPLSKRQIQSRVTHYGGKSKIKGVRVSCHTLRHTFAKLCVVNGSSAFHLMQILGHTDISMTKRYVNLFSNDVAEGHKKFSPLNNLRR